MDVKLAELAMRARALRPQLKALQAGCQEDVQVARDAHRRCDEAHVRLDRVNDRFQRKQ